MKLAPLLAQFLYSNKRLDLPGIGTFLLEGPIIEETDSKQGKSLKPGDISFENNHALKETPDLVQYISSQTGKIKALAAADLDSHLNVVQQFLNIGKPFLLEGIGSLVKIKSGEYAFSSGDILSEKFKDYTAKEISATSSIEESFSDYKKPMNTGNSKNWRKPAVILLIIAGIGLAVWGGYTVYKITTAKNRSAKKEDIKKDETVLVPDTAAQKKDSTAAVVQVPTGSFRFVLEVANAKRAFERYSRLKEYQWDVQMETKDSVTYKLFMVLPVAVADTSHVVDSLSGVNGRRVYIEQ
ncbi:MAG: hypothetical protein HOP10_02810 [Chitinophagaceae bacterium]|nr:hypothetical protein [Chitinophagaceae bacterium]